MQLSSRIARCGGDAGGGDAGGGDAGGGDVGGGDAGGGDTDGSDDGGGEMWVVAMRVVARCGWWQYVGGGDMGGGDAGGGDMGGGQMWVLKLELVALAKPHVAAPLVTASRMIALAFLCAQLRTEVRTLGQSVRYLEESNHSVSCCGDCGSLYYPLATQELAAAEGQHPPDPEAALGARTDKGDAPSLRAATAGVPSDGDTDISGRSSSGVALHCGQRHRYDDAFQAQRRQLKRKHLAICSASACFGIRTLADQ